jgi:predicted dehydrogenase
MVGNGTIETFGVIGCGLIGARRAAAAAGQGLSLLGAADLDADRAARLIAASRRPAPGAVASGDWRAVVAARPDLMFIATSHDRLAEITLAAVEAGCHVLVEKPAARTAGELDPVIAAAARGGRMVKVGFNHRFHPAIRKAHAIAASGALGPLMFVRGRYGHGGRPGMETEWRCMPERSGGGELIDQGAHLIDLSRWFLGEFTQVQGMLGAFFWDSPVEDNAFVGLRTQTGQSAWLHASWSEWKNLFSFEIYGRGGKLHIEGLGGSYGVERLTHYHMLPQMGPPETTAWEFPFPDRSWDEEVAETLAAAREGRRPLGDIIDAKETLMIIDRLYAQGRGAP